MGVRFKLACEALCLFISSIMLLAIVYSSGMRVFTGAERGGQILLSAFFLPCVIEACLLGCLATRGWQIWKALKQSPGHDAWPQIRPRLARAGGECAWMLFYAFALIPILGFLFASMAYCWVNISISSKKVVLPLIISCAFVFSAWCLFAYGFRIPF